MAQNPSYEEVRDLINKVMNTDTSDVLITPSKPKAKGAKMAEPMMKDAGPKAEMPAVEEEAVETAAVETADKPAAKPAKMMTAAELAEKAGVTEEELMSFLEKSGLMEQAGGMEGLLAALAASPDMVDDLVNLIKTTQGQGNANKVPMV
tara:strand:+ start:13220 stop:13666 length:447 start_codon:yes stop_codon:yes gene_type:complete